jgi:hypothetical protein
MRHFIERATAMMGHFHSFVTTWLRHLWVVGIALLLASCASASSDAGRSCKAMDLNLSPASLGYSLSLSQVVTRGHEGDDHSIRFEVEITPKQVVMVGLSHFGVRLVTLKQDSDGIKVNTLGGKKLPFEPCFVFSDMKLAHWPEDVLRKALLVKGHVIKGDEKGLWRRIFKADGSLMVEINYQLGPDKTGVTELKHFDFPYSLRIKTVQRKRLP